MLQTARIYLVLRVQRMNILHRKELLKRKEGNKIYINGTSEFYTLLQVYLEHSKKHSGKYA